MIIDIDSRESIQSGVEQLSGGWFNPGELYACLKTDKKTTSSDFWNKSTHMLADISCYLGCPQDQFLSAWDRRCISSDTKFMGYHCTCHSDKKAFLKKGILPLSEETVRLSENVIQAVHGKALWDYRSQHSPGPWFLLSYKCAKKPDNHFCLKGPEILSACTGHHVGVDPATSIPMIIHCAIPYLYLSEKNYFAFCLFRAYFNFIDPESDSDDLFDGYSIDLRGQALDPNHIIEIEEIKQI
ncbi:MAG: hypothetical protein EPN22_15940 [Nitrospirae bacterium]|nr:MAG: hypothetical protein EPN22_15940 [Nitrospirota bacterium]